MPKTKEIKKLGLEEIESRLTELKKELMKANAQRSTGTSLKNPGQLRQTKKAIARILTRKKELIGKK